jgi:toxin FitB
MRQMPISLNHQVSIRRHCWFQPFIFKRVLQEFGEERALDAMGVMSLSAVTDLDRQTAVHAAQISNELKLAMADSIILATARAYDATLWTQDEHFKDIEGVKYRQKKAKK